MSDLYAKLAQSHPALVRARVRCETCGRTQAVDATRALRVGWPKCHGYTMTLLPAKETP